MHFFRLDGDLDLRAGCRPDRVAEAPDDGVLAEGEMYEVLRAHRLDQFYFQRQLRPAGRGCGIGQVQVFRADAEFHVAADPILDGRDNSGRWERVTPLKKLSVRSPTGAPSDVEVIHEDSIERIRVGDPDKTVSGKQTYVLSYELAGVVNAVYRHPV